MKISVIYLGFFCLFISIIDTEIIKYISSRKLSTPPIVTLTPMCSKVKVLVEKRDDFGVKKLDREIRCESLDSYIYQSNYLLLNFGNYEGVVNVDGYSYNIEKNKNVEIVSNGVARFYIIIRIGIGILALFLLRKLLFRELLPIVTVTTLILLFYPGNGGFDIVDYLKIYKNFPNYLDNEYSLARIVPFLLTYMLTGSVFVYKLIQVCFCSFSIFYFVEKIIERKYLQYITFLFIVCFGCFIKVAYSYTDLFFVGIFLLKLSYLKDLIASQKSYSKYLIVSIFLAAYRANSIVLIAFDLLVFAYLKLSRKYVSVFLLVFFTFYGLSYGVFIDEEDTGYGGYAVLYELHGLYPKYSKELDWLPRYINNEALERERQGSLISTYYRGASLDEDLLERKVIAQEYEEIYQKYYGFFLKHPLEIIKQKSILFGYFLGLKIDTGNSYLNDSNISYFYKNEGDFSFFNQERSLEFPVFKMNKFNLGDNFIGRTWIFAILLLFLLVWSLYKKKIYGIALLGCTLFYTFSFLIVSHGYLLTYSYYLVIVAKVFIVRFYELKRYA